MLHHLMVGTWTPPGAIFTFEFDDEKLSLKLIKKTSIPHDEPISWMTFDVSGCILPLLGRVELKPIFLGVACEEESIWSWYEKVVQLYSIKPYGDSSSCISSYGRSS